MSNNWRMVYEFILSEELLEFYKMSNFLTEYSELIDERFEMNPFYVPFQRNLLQLNPVLNVNPNACLFVRDNISNKEFLIDTGAARSIYPRDLIPERIKPKRNRNNNFLAANSTLIGTYGTTKMRLDFGLGRVFNWNFTIADTADLIIGADFLDYYNILVDIRKRRILLNNEENE